MRAVEVAFVSRLFD